MQTPYHFEWNGVKARRPQLPTLKAGYQRVQWWHLQCVLFIKVDSQPHTREIGDAPRKHTRSFPKLHVCCIVQIRLIQRSCKDARGNLLPGRGICRIHLVVLSNWIVTESGCATKRGNVASRVLITIDKITTLAPIHSWDSLLEAFQRTCALLCLPYCCTTTHLGNFVDLYSDWITAHIQQAL